MTTAADVDASRGHLSILIMNDDPRSVKARHVFSYNGSPIAKKRVRNLCNAFRLCFRGVFDSLPQVPRAVASRNGTRAHAVFDSATTPSCAATGDMYPSLPRGSFNYNARNDCPGAPRPQNPNQTPHRAWRVYTYLSRSPIRTLLELDLSNSSLSSVGKRLH